MEDSNATSSNPNVDLYYDEDDLFLYGDLYLQPTAPIKTEIKDEAQPSEVLNSANQTQNLEEDSNNSDLEFEAIQSVFELDLEHGLKQIELNKNESTLNNANLFKSHSIKNQQNKPVSNLKVNGLKEEKDTINRIKENKATDVVDDKPNQQQTYHFDEINVDTEPYLEGILMYDNVEFMQKMYEEKPWTKPGEDITDYFNYGFNERTWRRYCDKQRRTREDNYVLHNSRKKQRNVDHLSGRINYHKDRSISNGNSRNETRKIYKRERDDISINRHHEGKHEGKSDNRKRSKTPVKKNSKEKDKKHVSSTSKTSSSSHNKENNDKERKTSHSSTKTDTKKEDKAKKDDDKHTRKHTSSKDKKSTERNRITLDKDDRKKHKIKKEKENSSRHHKSENNTEDGDKKSSKKEGKSSEKDKDTKDHKHRERRHSKNSDSSRNGTTSSTEKNDNKLSLKGKKHD